MTDFTYKHMSDGLSMTVWMPKSDQAMRRFDTADLALAKTFGALGLGHRRVFVWNVRSLSVRVRRLQKHANNESGAQLLVLTTGCRNQSFCSATFHFR